MTLPPEGPLGPSLADLLNSPAEIDFEGAKYPLRQPTLREKGQFQRWLEQSAREAAGRADELPADVYDRLLAHAARDIACKVYAWGGAACVTALGTPSGVARLVYFILSNDGADVTPEFCERMVECRLKEIAAVVAAAETDDPKLLAAVLTLMGLPPTPSPPGSPASATPPSDTSPGRSSGSPTDRSSPSTPGTSGTSTASPS